MSGLTGKRVGVTPGYSYDDEFDGAANFTRDETDSFESNIRKLLVGRIDYFMVDESVGLYNAKWMGVHDKLGVATLRYPGGGNFVAFSQKPENLDLSRRFNTALIAFKKTPEYREILKQYGQ